VSELPEGRDEIVDGRVRAALVDADHGDDPEVDDPPLDSSGRSRISAVIPKGGDSASRRIEP